MMIKEIYIKYDLFFNKLLNNKFSLTKINAVKMIITTFA